MRCYCKMLFAAMTAFTAACFLSGAGNHAYPAFQDSVAAEEEQVEDPGYTEEEYNEYMAATKEPDLVKQGEMLLAFIEKYPESKLMSYIDTTYKNLLFQLSESGKYQELEILTEKWLQLHPDDYRLLGYIIQAATNLGHNEKLLNALLELYKIEPSADRAFGIAKTYKSMNNDAKYLEWIKKVFEYPEYDTNFALRFDLVQYYLNENDIATAAEYARKTLQAVNLVQEPSAETKEHLRAVRHACRDIIGRCQYNNDQFDEAIQSFQQALNEEEYADGWYYIGLCQRNQEKIDDAMISLAKAELLGGDVAPKAKSYLEQLYKALHNDTLIGIEKIYRKAKEQLQQQNSVAQGQTEAAAALQ
jgi:tetratricopeptide (TPR) repeat protein